MSWSIALTPARVEAHRHSEQMPHARQRAASAWACFVVIARLDFGEVVRALRHVQRGIARAAAAGISPRPCASCNLRSVKLDDRQLRSCGWLQLLAAAGSGGCSRRPCDREATASITNAVPEMQSPAAKTPGRVAASVLGLTAMVCSARHAHAGVSGMNARPARWPTEKITVSQGRRAPSRSRSPVAGGPSRQRLNAVTLLALHAGDLPVPLPRIA